MKKLLRAFHNWLGDQRALTAKRLQEETNNATFFEENRFKPFDADGNRIAFWGDLDNPGPKRPEYPVYDVAAPRTA